MSASLGRVASALAAYYTLQFLGYAWWQCAVVGWLLLVILNLLAPLEPTRGTNSRGPR